ncbi:MAG: ribosomal protein S18-alanine N-acetyltransferase [Burkholderiaceae bacterium]|nr:ribosomal protein S18-alanine N-acetyltransferase [Burkholderiaceae bacterium]
MSALPNSTPQPESAAASALAAAGLHLRALSPLDLPAIMAIETQVYAQPWSEGNFKDSLASGYEAFGLWGPAAHASDAQADELRGYCLAMPGVDEMHLLNISVHPAYQGQGLAQAMLTHLVQRCRALSCAQLWLEVRHSNQRARMVYHRYGFSEVGLRRAYYPAHLGLREDAVLMSLPIAIEKAGQEPQP